MKQIEVVAAIIQVENKFLCLQRKVGKYDYTSLKYEFPGSKVEAGESQRQALTREIREELQYDIQVEQKFLTIEHQYPDFQSRMHSYLCSASNTNLTLTEHIDCQWLRASQLDRLDWVAADIPIVKRLMQR